ncbi:hypothetical protein GCM10018954_031030 [Kutzneria kofuensis]
MRGVWTADQVRAAEQRVFTRVPESRLMRIAAYAVANEVLALLAARTGGTSGRRVGLLVGAGNNGGDALWAGAFLRRRGVSVTAVLLAPERAHAAGLAAFRRAGGRVGDSVAGADVVVDGIVGLSAKGSLRPDAAALVESVTAPIVAVDLPSGVDPDTGAVDGPHVEAAVTVTFGGRKPCHVVGPGAVACGRVRVVDIGIGDDLDEPYAVLLDAEDVADAWPIPGPSDDKYTQGVTGIAAGSATYPGAAVLATGAAVLATSGMVRYAGTAADVVRSRWPEVVATGHVGDSGRVQAWVVGPGLGTGQAGRQVLADVLAADVPVCADADAITLLAGDPTLWDARDPDTAVVLTPHDREFARLAGDVGPDRIAAARRAAARSALSCCSRATPPSSPPPTAGSSSTSRGPRGPPPPAPATFSPASSAPCSPPASIPGSPPAAPPTRTNSPPTSPPTAPPPPPRTSRPPSPTPSATFAASDLRGIYASMVGVYTVRARLGGSS